MWKQFKGFLFHLFPHHLVSRFTFWLTRLESPLKNPAIRIFIRAFDVDMSESSKQAPEEFSSFNKFFTRELISNARPIDNDPNSVISPADGRISQITNYEMIKPFKLKAKIFPLLSY